MPAENVTPAATTEALPSISHASEMKLLADHVSQLDGNVSSSSSTTVKEMPKTVPAKTEVVPKTESASKEPKKEATAKEALEETPKPVASGWEAIKRAEKRQREESAKASRMLEEAKALVAGNKPLLDELRADPLAFLEKNGVEFRTLVERVVKGGVIPRKEAPKEDPVLKRVAELEARLKERDIDDALSQHRGTVEATLKGEQFALLATRSDAVEQVQDFIAQYLQANGEVLPPERAASILQDTWRDELRTLSSHAAVREILGLSATTEEAPKEKHEPKKQASKKTLTNDLDGTTGTFKEDDQSVLDDDDDLRKAIKLIPPDAWKNMA